MTLFVALLLLGLGFAAGGSLAMWLRWRHSAHELRIIEVLARDEGQLSGFEIGDRSKVPAGTVYEILGRLVRIGMVRSQWQHHGVHRRRYYRWLGDDPEGL